MKTTINHGQLKVLAENGGVKSVTVLGESNSFFLNISTISGEKMLHNKVGELRSFKKMETVLDYLKFNLGIARCSINFERWNPKQVTLK